MYNYVTQPQEYQAFTMFDEHTHTNTIHAATHDDDSLYPIPKGKFLAPFLPFRTSCMYIFVRVCSPFKSSLKCGFKALQSALLQDTELLKLLRHALKSKTHKTPLEQSSLILSIYFSSLAFEIKFSTNTHALYLYTDICEIIGDKGNFISRQ